MKEIRLKIFLIPTCYLSISIQIKYFLKQQVAIFYKNNNYIREFCTLAPHHISFWSGPAQQPVIINFYLIPN